MFELHLPSLNHSQPRKCVLPFSRQEILVPGGAVWRLYLWLQAVGMFQGLQDQPGLSIPT